MLVIIMEHENRNGLDGPGSRTGGRGTQMGFGLGIEENVCVCVCKRIPVPALTFKSCPRPLAKKKAIVAPNRHSWAAATPTHAYSDPAYMCNIFY